MIKINCTTEPPRWVQNCHWSYPALYLGARYQTPSSAYSSTNTECLRLW